MRVACLFTGGKDSTLAAHLMESNGYETILVTFMPKRKHSYMLHSENLNLTKLQAKALGMHHYMFYVSGIKEREVSEMLTCLKKLKEELEFDAICSGAVESEYQKQRIDYISEKLHVPAFCPLWKRFSLLQAYEDMEILVVKVSAYGLDKNCLGKQFKDIKNEFIHPFFEGGEAETAVLDAPFFNSRIIILKKEIKWHKDWGELIIKDAEIREK
ncbi:MAG: diphthine--ammonia ligase [Candidatus Anstonellales archaeon]